MDGRLWSVGRRKKAPTAQQEGEVGRGGSDRQRQWRQTARDTMRGDGASCPLVVMTRTSDLERAGLVGPSGARLNEGLRPHCVCAGRSSAAGLNPQTSPRRPQDVQPTFCRSLDSRFLSARPGSELSSSSPSMHQPRDADSHIESVPHPRDECS